MTNGVIFSIQTVEKSLSNQLSSSTDFKMTTDQDKPGPPAKRLADDGQIQPDTIIREITGYPPTSGTIDTNDKIRIALEEGYDPMAVELALKNEASSPMDKLRMLILVFLAAILVFIMFPLNRFFKPAPRDLGAMSIGGPVLKESSSPAHDSKAPWLTVLIKIDNLYFREGRLTDAIRLAEAELEKIPEQDWESWQKVYYRYWELLSGAGRIQVLKNSTKAYLTVIPEDPFANYFYARAFLTAADRIRSYSNATKSAYRQQAEDVAQQIAHACSALDARRRHPDIKEDKIAALTDLYQKLRLEQANVYVLIWKLGGYREDEHPDVIYRDKALEIIEGEELSDMKEAKAIKAIIYTHILDRWYWFEGRQIIQNRKQRRKDLQKQLDALNRELRAAKNP